MNISPESHIFIYKCRTRQNLTFCSVWFIDSHSKCYPATGCETRTRATPSGRHILFKVVKTVAWLYTVCSQSASDSLLTSVLRDRNGGSFTQHIWEINSLLLVLQRWPRRLHLDCVAIACSSSPVLGTGGTAGICHSSFPIQVSEFLLWKQFSGDSARGKRTGLCLGHPPAYGQCVARVCTSV